jgi:hypothetical protein
MAPLAPAAGTLMPASSHAASCSLSSSVSLSSSILWSASGSSWLVGLVVPSGPSGPSARHHGGPGRATPHGPAPRPSRAPRTARWPMKPSVPRTARPHGPLGSPACFVTDGRVPTGGRFTHHRPKHTVMIYHDQSDVMPPTRRCVTTGPWPAPIPAAEPADRDPKGAPLATARPPLPTPRWLRPRLLLVGRG